MDPQTIANDIAAVGNFISPIVKDLAPGIGTGVELAFKIAAKAEPAAYQVIKALVSGTDLTADQQQVLADAQNRLANPDQYFADPSPPSSPTPPAA